MKASNVDVTDLARMVLALPKEDRDHLRAALAVDAAGGTDGRAVLDLPMLTNDAEAATVRGYLKALLRELWTEQEGFSGKRPFGNSGWSNELDMALVKAGRIPGSLSPEGYLQEADHNAGHRVILKAIEQL